jgi:hypothetical protein
MLKRFILWDFPRGGWQYDVMVGIILAFIFLTPRAVFRDQPRIPNARSIAMLPPEHGIQQFWIDKELLGEARESDWKTRLTEVLRTQTGNAHLSVIDVKRIGSSEDEPLGFLAYARP